MTETTPLDTTAAPASQSTTTPIGRRGDGWVRRTDVDLGLIEPLLPTSDSVPAAQAPKFAPGEIISWQDDDTVAVAGHVISDDDRGLVCWIPEGAQGIMNVPREAAHIRDIPLRERAGIPQKVVAFAWQGPGIVRVAPTGKPWSVWFFWHPDGSFKGTYVNLELPHRRRPGVAMIETLDLTLDMWCVGDDVWLKDDDELALCAELGRLTSAQAQQIHHLADLAREELVEQRQWPMDAGFEDFVAEPTWGIPVLPEHAFTAKLWALVDADANVVDQPTKS